MKNYSFKQCSLNLLEKLFGLEEVKTSPILEDWLEIEKKMAISDREKMLIEHYQDLMCFNLRSWNEQELALNFIGPFMATLGIQSKKYNLFAERLLDATIKDVNNEDVVLNGRPDSFIASGFREPETPFFYFHEHKPEADSSGDPAGQVLAAMLVGQAKNPTPELPIYGCYVIGQNWYFMTLDNKEYAIATPFATTNQEIFPTFRMLKAVKGFIEARL
jgi:hypothetical protein